MTGLKKLLMLKAASGGGTAPQTETLSGSLVTFETTKARLLKECRVDFLPVQEGSGDPSPENVRPISGWTGCDVVRCGKNLFDGEYPDISTGLRYRPIYVGNGKVTVSTNAPRGSNGANLFALAGSVTSGASTGLNNVDKDQARTVTPVNDYITIAYRRDSVCDPQDYDTQIEVGQTATSYEPYTTTSYPITWQSAGTVYGGYADLVRGELVVDRKIIRAKWGDYTIRAGDKYYERRVYPHGSNVVIGNGGGNVISNVAKKKWNDSRTDSHFYVADTLIQMILPTDTSMDLNIDVCVVLATPLTYTLTPQQITTLIGTNNIWSDAGNVTVTYTK